MTLLCGDPAGKTAVTFGEIVTVTSRLRKCGSVLGAEAADLIERLVDAIYEPEFDITKPPDTRQNYALAMLVLARFERGEGPLTTGDAGRMRKAIQRYRGGCRIVTSPRFYGEEERQKAIEELRDRTDRMAWPSGSARILHQSMAIDAIAQALGMRRAKA